MRALARLRSLIRDQSGNALMVGAATLPLIVGAAAIAVDTAQVTVARRQLQRTADSAALAGAYALAQGQPVATSVNHDLAFNNDMPLNGSPIIQNAPSVGPYAGNNRAVRVVLAHQRAVPFMSFFRGETMDVSVEATAAIVFTGQYCMISLEDDNVTGISFGGNTTVNLGCGVVSNSTSSSAVSAGGSATVVASPIAAVGGVPASGAYATGTTLLPRASPQADPYSALPEPTLPPSSSCRPQLTVQPNDPVRQIATSEAASPGVYCFRGMDIKGSLNLLPGTYYIDGGTLSFGSQAVVNGTGVTFILTSRTATTNPSSIATVNMNGGAQVNLTSPTSGTYKGVLMYQDRRALYGSNTINGNSSSSFEGGFYFPSQQLTFNGTTGMQTTCIQLVARRLSFSGNSTVQNTCPSTGGGRAFDVTAVRLVG